MKKILLGAIIFGLTFSTAPAIAATSPIAVTKFQYDAPGNDNSNKNAEYVVLKNKSSKTLNLHNWKVSDKNNKHKLTIENIKLKKGETLTIYSGKGKNTTTGKSKKVYWNNRTAIWDNNGDVLTLKNDKGKKILTHTYKK